MQFTASLDAPVPPAALYPWICDLASYPAWLELVQSADPEPASNPPAWDVILTARLGPLKRSKRLRMVAVRRDPEIGATFERAEADGKDHSMWRLDAALTPTEHGSRLEMSLYYSGKLWVAPLEKLLAEEVEAGRGRLLALAGAEAGEV